VHTESSAGAEERELVVWSSRGSHVSM